jgi:hypothetical protein
MNYHVRISLKSGSTETKCDLTEEQLRTRVISPYETAAPLILNGKTILSGNIDRVRVSKSTQTSAELIVQIKDEERNSSVVVISSTPYTWYAADRADDVTDEFIEGPIGFRATEASEYTAESDAIFGKILTLADSSLLPQEYKEIVKSDVSESQRSYSIHAYKSAVVMLGAALEGLMLGTLQRADVLAHLRSMASPPGPIRAIGNQDPHLSTKIADDLTFQDYKVCVHDLVPGSDALGVDNIQEFRNAIHPLKSINEPLRYGNFDQARAIHHLASLQKIFESLGNWTP